MSGEELSEAIKSLNQRQTALGDIKQRLGDEMINVVVMRKFFEAWESELKKIEGLDIHNASRSEIKAAYEKALDKVESEDDPKTPMNEKFDESDLMSLYEKVHKDRAFPDPDKFEVDGNDVAFLAEEISDLRGELRKYMARQMIVDSEKDAIVRQGEDLRSTQEDNEINTDEE